MVEDNPFKPKKQIGGSIEEQIDEELKSLHNRDKIKLMNNVKEKPPEQGDMTVSFEEGVYQVDLRTLLNAQISDCPATVIPMLIDHGVRTAVDIKDTYKPEKRFVRFEYWWIIFLILGFGIGFLVLNMLGLI